MANQVTLWLNYLTHTEARSLLEIMCTTVGTSATAQVSGGASPLGLNCLPANSPRTGDWYMEWASCEIIGLLVSGGATGHPRWQPRVVNKVGNTPANPTAVGRSIRSRLRDDAWEWLKTLASSNGQVKIPRHHLAFLAGDDGMGASTGLPVDLGAGSSMSHLCDSVGCIRDSHLELTLQHVDNLERQRCTGVTLIASMDLIIHEVPCGHARGGTSEERIASSCRKLRMVWLPDASVAALLDNYQQIHAALSFSTPSSSQYR